MYSPTAILSLVQKIWCYMQKEKEQTFSDKEKSPSLWQREGTEGRECQYERLKPTIQAAQEK